MVAASAPSGPGKNAPSRAWYAVAAVLFIAGLTAATFFARSRLAGIGDNLVQFLAPGRADINLAEPGTYTIYHEPDSVLDGKLYASGTVSGLRVSVQSPAGDAARMAAPSGTSSYTFGGRSGVSFLTFEAKQSGTYRFVAGYDDGRTRPQTVLAVDRGFFGVLARTILGAAAMAIAGIAVAVTILVIVSVKRRKAAPP